MKVSLIGAGPGDPGLLTLAARDILARADVIIYDALANIALLRHARPDAELIYVGKKASQHALPQDEINALLARKAREGLHVARLKGGDPYIFGRGGEEGEYLRKAGVPYEEIPGVSSAIAAPAYAGIPVTHRDYTSSVIIATGHESPDKEKSAHNWQALAKSGSTLVFVMGMKNLSNITARLMKAGLSGETPAALIQNGTTPFQRVLEAPLQKLAADAHAQGFTSPAVIVIGDVVKLRRKLDWFGERPLLGRRILVTRSREQASALAELLESMGAAVYQCPAMEIRPLTDYSTLDAAIGQLANYNWLIFTSANGVKYFWQRLAHAGLDSRSLGSLKVAAIGPATADALKDKGINPDLLPPRFVAESLVQALKETGTLSGQRILIPRAYEARMVLPDELAKAGAIVDVAPAYVALPARQDGDAISAMIAKGDIDCIAFASSSTVRNFLNLIPARELKGKTVLAAIGPITAQTLQSAGLEAAIEPDEFTIPALASAIAAYFAKKEGV